MTPKPCHPASLNFPFHQATIHLKSCPFAKASLEFWLQYEPIRASPCCCVRRIFPYDFRFRFLYSPDTYSTRKTVFPEGIAGFTGTPRCFKTVWVVSTCCINFKLKYWPFVVPLYLLYMQPRGRSYWKTSIFWEIANFTPKKETQITPTGHKHGTPSNEDL